jgi:hypothetical protein
LCGVKTADAFSIEIKADADATGKAVHRVVVGVDGNQA